MPDDPMDNPRPRDAARWWKRPYVVAVVLVVFAVVAGGLTFVIGSLTSRPPEGPSASQLDVAAPAPPERWSRQVLKRMSWGDGAEDAYRSEVGVPSSSLEAVFPAEDGAFVVVDHVPGVFGARLRSFDESGTLRVTTTAPGGSTLFRPWPGGFAYVIAKTTLPYEQLVIADAGGSVVESYTVPMQLNSEAIVRSGDDIYVGVLRSTVDPEQLVATAEHLLVPVARSGQQLSDDEAADGTLQAWTIGEDGARYAQRFESSDTGAGSAQVRLWITRERDGATLDIPTAVVPVGVDGEGRLLAYVPPLGLPAGAAGLPGWSAADEGRVRFLVSAMDGELRSRIVVARHGMLRSQRDAYHFSGSELLIAVPDPAGVAIVRYRRVPR